MSKIILFSFLCLMCIQIACNPEDLLKEKKAPVVSLIHSSVADFTINPGESIKLWVTASDPEGGSLSYKWTSELSGAIVGTAQSDTVHWQAPPVGGGNYWIRVAVSNEDKTTTKQEEIIVRSAAAPYLKIVKPEQGDYLVQFTATEITAECGHQNGIAVIDFWINDSLWHSVAGRSDDIIDLYSYNWPADANAGMVKIKLAATARVSGATAKDSITVSLEGIVPGKN